jgi:hypothetical protein
MEPFRKTFLTASNEIETFHFNAFANRVQKNELEALIARGGDNSDTMGGRLRQIKKQLKRAKKAEAGSAGVRYEWTINSVSYEGATIGPVECKLDSNEAETTVVISLRVLKGEKVVSMEDKKVPCRYVRRSMWGLSAGDRQRFLAAAQTLYSDTTTVGRQKYGRDFVGAKDLWAMHAALGADETVEHKVLAGGAAATVKSNSFKEQIMRGWQKTQSYFKKMPQSGNGVFMEIDGDTNDYTKENTFDHLLFRTGAGQSLIAAKLEDKDSSYSETALLAATSKHNLLAASHDIGVLTNYAAFAVTMEKSLQAVDPAVAMPFIDLADPNVKDNGHTFDTVTWRERFDVSSTLLDSVDNSRAKKLSTNGAAMDRAGDVATIGRAAAGGELQRIETEGTWGYVPIFTGRHKREVGTVYKGFALPLIMHAPAEGPAMHAAQGASGCESGEGFSNS